MKHRQNFYQKIFCLNLIFVLFFSCGGEKKDNKNFKFLAALIFQSDSASSNSKNQSELPKVQPELPKVQPVEKLNIKDPLYKDQWYLKNTGQKSGTAGIDINIEPVWKQGYTGKGVFIGVLDDPVQKDHPDLKDNVISMHDYYDDISVCYTGQEGKPHARAHGTNVAGVIVAKNNNIGIRGVAYEAKVYGYGVLVPSYDISGNKEIKPSTNKDSLDDSLTKAFNRPELNKIAVYNASLGHGSSTVYRHLTPQIKNMLDRATQQGFYGKGASLVFAAGNYLGMGTATNESYGNHYATIFVSSINNKGESEEQQGQNIWLSAPGSSIKTTDVVGACNEPGDYTDISGTSFSAPLVSGVIALIRQANPNLRWRDVKLILAESSKKSFSDGIISQITGKMYSDPNQDQKYYQEGGFGILNAEAAIKLAKTWKLLPAMKKEDFTQTTQLDTPGKNQWYSSSLDVNRSNIKFIESVTLEMRVSKSKSKIVLANWDLVLVSPDNKEAKLFESFNNPLYNMSFLDENQSTMILLSNRFLGSSTIDGTWQLKIKQKRSVYDEYISAIQSWKLIIRGH